jgi:hypothetical protein
MKKLILLFLLLASCAKNKPLEYTSNLTQHGNEVPKSNELVNSFGGISWKRNDVGIYQGTYNEKWEGQINVVIDQTANGAQMVRVNANNEHVQVYTYFWDDEFKEWRFSDDVLLNTSVRILFFK